MSEETKETKQAPEPADDAVVVDDQLREETSHAELVAKVSKKLGRDEWGDEIADAKSTVTEETEDTPPEAEAKDEKPETPALSAELKSRAEKAGLTSEQAEKLNQNGLLEETLTAFDKTLLERLQAPKPEVKEPVTGTEDDDLEEMPELDPDIYDEEIVKRDRYHKQRIDSLQEQVELLLQDRQDAFEQRFDGVLSELGYDTADEQKCQKTFKAYKGLCEANDVNPEKCDRALIERAHAAMYPEEVKKQHQQKMVNSLRDAEGKFLSPSSSKGTPPPRTMTEEESHDSLVSNVAAYLKKQGVQMSGL